MRQLFLAVMILAVPHLTRADETPPVAAPETPAVTLHALAPEAMKTVGAMLDRLKPALPFSEVSINIDRINTRLCPAGAGDEACFVMNLYHRDSPCGGSVWGPFCVEFPSGTPPGESAALIQKTLAATGDTDLWITVHPTPGPETPTPTVAEPKAQTAPEASQAAEGSTAIVTAGLVLAALLGGLMLWLATRRRG
jgi:hypothetical protein